MKATRRTTIAHCEPFQGRPYDYQEAASQAHWVETGLPGQKWRWITTTCATEHCLTVDHMVLNEPIKLSYPAYVCIYCGQAGGTRDHLMPKHFTGKAARTSVITVPCCSNCNNLLSDTLTESITERRELAHLRIRRRNKRTLNQPELTPAEMRQFGHNLRTYIKDARTKKDILLDRLAWPHDENYDLRACQKSGIDDPYAIGLLLSSREEARNIAEGKL